MKKIKVAAAAFFLGALALTSCSSDDNSGSTPASINAKQTPTKTVVKVGSSQEIEEEYLNNEAGCDKDYVEFSATGSVFKDQYFYKNGSNVCTEDAATAPGTWSKTDDTLIINSEESIYDGNFTIETLSNTDLVISFDTQAGANTVTTSYHFKKV